MRACVIAPNWVGDAVMSAPMVARLSSDFDQIDVVAIPWVKQVYEAVPGVTDLIDNPLRHGAFPWTAARQLSETLASRAYAQIFVLPPSFKSALVPYWANIPVRTGYLGEWRHRLLNDIRACADTEPCANRYAMLAGLPAASPRVAPRLVLSRETSMACVNQLGLSLHKRLLILSPGAAFGPAKCWPAAHFAEVGRRFVARGGQVWITGSPKENSIAAEIISLVPEAVNLCTRTDLGQVMALLPLAHCVIANDSGLMHMACAFDRPTIGLYGSTDPAFAPPTGSVSRAFYLNLPCSPCRQRVCPLHHHDCLVKLLPDTVWAQVEDWWDQGLGQGE